MAIEFFEVLRKDHNEVKQLLEQIEKTTERGARKREELFSRLTLELVPHMKGEEKTFYPALGEKRNAARAKALKAIEEHNLSQTLIRELTRLPKVDEHWGPKLAVLRELLEHHIEEEEQQLFPLAEEALGPETLERLGQAFAKEKTTAKHRME